MMASLARGIRLRVPDGYRYEYVSSNAAQRKEARATEKRVCVVRPSSLSRDRLGNNAVIDSATSAASVTFCLERDAWRKKLQLVAGEATQSARVLVPG